MPISGFTTRLIARQAPVNQQSAPETNPPAAEDRDARFFDNRQKYLMFVNTCNEKRVTANRVSRELSEIQPKPPAARIFDAGIGDGTVLSGMLRAMHCHFPTMPFYVVGKEISLEDVRLTLDKVPDRMMEHPATVLVLTNLHYSEAPWLTPKSSANKERLIWREVALKGTCSYDFEHQIADLQPFLAQNWQATTGKSGNPTYERPVVLVMYREDHKFLLDPEIPRQDEARADYDLVIASQPYRARASAQFKAQKVIAPLSRALRSSGRLIGIHSYGRDPGMDIVQRIWPDDHPFQTDRLSVLDAVMKEMGPEAAHYDFVAGSDARSIFRYDMHTLPNEISSTIGTSTMFAAWNAAVYVAQIDDARLEKATLDGSYMEATREALKHHGGLWFNNESYVISRR